MRNIKEIKIEKDKIKKLRNKRFIKNLQKDAYFLLTISPIIGSLLFTVGSVKLGTYEKEYNYCVERTYGSEGNEEKNYLKDIKKREEKSTASF